MADFAVSGERFRQEPGKTLHDFLKRDQAWIKPRPAANGKWDGNADENLGCNRAQRDCTESTSTG
jgi:hypothetical protein